MLVAGLKGQGKTRFVEGLLQNLPNVILMNCFEDDFTTIDAPRITDEEEILQFLQRLIKEKPKKECVIVIDELLMLCDNKEINKAIRKVLAICRHFEWIIIGITQRAEKTELPFKNLFLYRICFKMIEESAYRTVLGFSRDAVIDRPLYKREFIYATESVGIGYTYDIGN